MPEPPFVAHVVSHTHWDREWYRTFEIFRMRLVDLVDALLDLLEADPAYGPFYLDGQVCPIEDYVAVRPEKADRLRSALSAGRVYAGPWYVQPDEFLVSGEALIRNLLLGRRLSERWGTGADIGYAPDAFGHISQMPQILRGFGIDNAVLFRGITADQAPAEFDWRSPDGSTVLCVKMPDDNAYSNWFYRCRRSLADTDGGSPLDADQVAAEGAALLDDCVEERPTTRSLLWMDGVDHIFPQPRTPEMIRILNARLGDRVRVKAANLREHIDSILADAPSLPAIQGELRVANRRWKLQALLAHVASSRIRLKQRNHACETLLERWTEPYSALVWLLARRLGSPKQADRLPEQASASPGCFLRHAWKTLLLNHPHDSICGCSVDQVHREMMPRFDAVEQVGEALTSRALSALAHWVNTEWRVAGADRSLSDAAHQHDDEHEVRPLAALVVFNPLSWSRSGELTEALVSVPQAGAPQGLGVFRNGEELDAVVEELAPCHTLTQAPHDIPVGAAWRRYKVSFLAEVPTFGYSVYHVAPKVPARRAETESGLEVGTNHISNGLIRIEAGADGALTMTDLRRSTVYRGLAVLEDGGDLGDGYNYVRPTNDEALGSIDPWPHGTDCRVEIERSEVEASITSRHRWFVPAGRDGDERDSTTQAAMDIVVKASIRPGSPRVDIHVNVDNRARDHRLRMLFPSGARNAAKYSVEQAFDVVDRPIARPDTTGWKEQQPGTGPQKAWVDVSDETQGLCVINSGLPECEVFDDAERTVAITLLRCTGGGVGLPEEQRDGQMLGIQSFRLALLPHAGNWLDARVWRAAHDLNAPLRAVQTDLHQGELKPEASFMEVRPEELVPTALKISDDETGVIVRCVNLGSEPVEPTVDLHVPGLASPRRVRLDEHPIDREAAVGPREIMTLRLDPA